MHRLTISNEWDHKGFSLKGEKELEFKRDLFNLVSEFLILEGFENCEDEDELIDAAIKEMIPVDYKTRKFYKKDTEVVDQNSSKRIFLSLENLQGLRIAIEQHNIKRGLNYSLRLKDSSLEE